MSQAVRTDRRDFLRRMGLMGAALPFSSYLLAACANDDTPNADSTDAAVKELILAFSLEPRSMDYVIIGDPFTNAIGSKNVWQTLTYRSSADASQIEPLLATDWTANGKSWTFKLREGVTFQTGQPFSSADVVGVIETVLDPDSGAEETPGYLLGVTGAKAIDELTVEIFTTLPDPVLPARMCLVGIPPNDVSASDRDKTMFGTGAYEFVEWNRGADLVLKARENPWDEPAKFSEVVVRPVLDECVRLSSLQAGEIHIAQSLSPDVAEGAPKISAGKSSQTAMLRLNATGGGPLSDVRVRQAVNYAIDRAAIIENIYLGYADPSDGQLLADFVIGYNPNMSDYPYDPDRARELLADAGAEGAEIDLSGSTGRTIKDREVAEACAEMMNQVGFNVKAQFPDFDRWVEQIFVAAEDDSKAPDTLFTVHGNELYDPEQSIGLYLASDGDASTYSNKEVDAVIAQARKELDPEKRTAAYQQMWEVLHEDAAYAAIANLQQVHGVVENLDWTPRPDGFINLTDVSFS